MSERLSAKVLMLHLDLGIGGAENLVVQVASSLQDLGCSVTILTSHHDINHCFEETKPNGKLGSAVHVYGDWLPRHFLGRFTAFFAILRMLLLAVVVVLWYSSYDVVFIDGVAAPIPLLTRFGQKVVYYCHFPDLLLCTDRSSQLKQLYRLVMDRLEAHATACASLILVNSEFTANVFRETFPRVYRSLRPQVLYPAVKISATFDRNDSSIKKHVPYCQGYDHIFFSLNRYERKKRIEVAIDALAHYKSLGSRSEANKAVLVIAGGYDLRVDENVQYLEELRQYCHSRGLTHCYLSSNDPLPGTPPTFVDVIFRTSISGTERQALLTSCHALLYTPDKEHFGIVPVEAMMQERAVIAVNSGGPVESVRHEVTGFLCEQTPAAFGDAMWRLVHEEWEGKPLYEIMGKEARRHAIALFSEKAMEDQLVNVISKVQLMK
eukprot:gene2367-2599_t